MTGDGLLEALGTAVPADARQAVPETWVPSLAGGAAVLDLGAGDGRGAALWRAHGARWTGVDIEGSAEAGERPGDLAVVAFDGVHLPFADASFDVVWCKQVLEHVERPEPLLCEVARVLRPGGTFCGSTSQLEPFHSRSTQNPTPYGVAVWCARAGLELVEVRASIDGPTLLARHLLGRARVFDRFWATESPVNRLVDLAGRARGWDARRRAAVKLVLCGQFAFRAVRQES